MTRGTIHHEDQTVTLHHGDCLDVLRELPDNSVDSIVTDPPYGLGFMGKEWDKIAQEASRPPSADETDARFNNKFPRAGKGPAATKFDGLAFQLWCEAWTTECLRVLKPGGHLLAFGGTRTWHRLAVAVEDAGFEIRDSIAWMYGSGFPKSLDVSKAIDKAARGVPQGGVDPTSPNHGQYRTTTTEGKRWNSDKGQSYGAGGSRFLTSTVSERITAPSMSGTPETDAAAVDGSPAPTLDATATEWQGWGTALKPAFEPVVVARKPLVGTVAGNVLAHGTGALNVDGCRVEGAFKSGWAESGSKASENDSMSGANYARDPRPDNPAGRWPANVILDESQAAALDAQSGEQRDGVAVRRNGSDATPQPSSWDKPRIAQPDMGYGEGGGASRFFYVAKADASERVRVDGIAHPTVKPLSIMRWLVRLVTPPGGTVLEPFAGSGTTVEACILEGFRCIAIERETDYLPLIVQRINRRRDPVAAVKATGDDGGLFDLLNEEPA